MAKGCLILLCVMLFMVACFGYACQEVVRVLP